jgi:hypothetical protein
MKPLVVIKKVWTPYVPDLIDQFKRIDSGVRNSAPCFVFKVNKFLRANLESDKNAREQIVTRSVGKPVYLLEYDIEPPAKHRLHEIQLNGIVGIEDHKLIEAIRNSDLSEVISKTRGDCIIDAPPNAHFITPSEKHTTRFLRLADALHSYDALDRISYWLQSEMAGASGIIIDTWSLSSIVLRSQQLLGIDVPFDCFRKHIKNDEAEAIRILNELKKRMVGNGPLLCLVSISSSGFFFKKFEELVKKSNIQNAPKVLSIFKFKNAPEDIKALATLDLELEFYNGVQDCIHCNDTKRVKTYEIDPKFYYPREFKEEIIKFDNNLLQDSLKGKSPSSKFIHKYGKVPGVLRVHKDDPNDGLNPRHHSFYIDVATLLDDDNFKKELCAALEKIRVENIEPTVVVTPPHDAGVLLADIACELLGAKRVIHHNLQVLSVEERLLITSAKHIIFLDDVLITGSRITEYNRTLRETYKGELNSLAKITWFPVIARPSSESVIDDIKDSLSNHSWKNEFKYLYEIVLPDWIGDRDCPWCAELAVFDREIGSLFAESKWYKERRDSLLHGKKQGISKDPLFLLPNIERATAGSGSKIVDAGSSEMQVIFLFAIGLQRLRHIEKTPLGPGLLQSYVLAMHGKGLLRRGTFQRFSEALFQAAFLRTVRCDEWDRDVKSMGVNFLVATHAKKRTLDGIMGEIILFLHRMGYSNSLPKVLENGISQFILEDEAVAALVKRFGDDT